MALENLPDLRFKGQVPMAAIVAAYQERARQENQQRMQQEQLKRQKLQDTLQAFQMGSNLVSQLVNTSRQVQQRKLRDEFAGMIANQNKPRSRVVPEAGTIGEQPGYSEQLKAKALQAYPEMAAQAQISNLFEEKDPLDQQLKQAKLEKTRRESKSGGVDTPPKIRGEIINRKRRGQKVSEFEEKLIASETRDPYLSTAVSVFSQDPTNLALKPQERVEKLEKLYETIKAFGESVLIQTSDGQTIRIRKQDLAEARKRDPKLKIIKTRR